MEINEKEIRALSTYVAEWLTEEGIPVSSFQIADALEAYIGGAADTE